MISPPLALIAEVTHRCPLKCLYCSNPLELKSRESEIPAAVWQRVFKEAHSLGVRQVHITGGEPLARTDLAELIHDTPLYINLITSGVGLSDHRLDELIDAGVEHIQLSFQDIDPDSSREICGVNAHAPKLEAARRIRAQDVGFTINMVVHRLNLPRLEAMIDWAASLGPDRLEIAHAQYSGWALKNRAQLLPSREQVDRSIEIVADARERYRGKTRIEFVLPDTYARFPKACMGGWGKKFILVDPSGQALPCHAAATLPLQFDSVTERSLSWIWENSPSFNAYRGENWMREPCRSCERRTQDFGGCRCQAFALTGDAANADPVCSYSRLR